MNIGSLPAIAAAGTVSPAIGASVLSGTEHLEAAQVDILMASLGVGNNVNAYA
ncbi:MAG: hypothetical protein ACRENA_05780 [Vulcanimicrobiaceae bacterium]